MSFRRIVAVALLVGLAGVLLPAGADAGPRAADTGFIARVLERVERLVTGLTLVFEARETGTISPNG